MVILLTRSFLSIFFLALLLASEVQAGLATFAVGADSTFINVFTRESRRNGEKVGRVRVDLRKIEALCRDRDGAFEGFVRLVPEGRVRGNEVAIECLQRAEDPRMAAVRAEGAPAKR